MPIYEYKCPRCGARFEKLIRSTAVTAEVECPGCAHRGVERTVSLCGKLGGTRGGGDSCGPSGGG